MCTVSSKNIVALKNYWSKVDDLKSIGMILHWDKQTQMPKSGTTARADHLSTVQGLVHGLISSPELKQILDNLGQEESKYDYNSDEAGMIRAARREYDEATKLPEELVKEKIRVASRAYQSWLQAREEQDFKLFVPELKESVEIARKTSEALGYDEHPLDALIEQHEPGFKTSELDQLFSEIREFIVPLVKKIANHRGRVSDKVLLKEYDPETQWKLGQAAVRAIHFKLDEGRCDRSVHPFSIYFSPNDVRITSRTKRYDFRPCFFGFLHEAGHGQYMQGIPVKYRRTPLMGGISSGMHESQSRMWENLVGRSRAFTNNIYPVVQAFFPEQTRGVSVEDWYNAINCVSPSYIRVEADEVTYNLHIMLRFEIEKGVIEGTIKVEDLEEVWNEKFKKYLGIVPPNPTLGVLQDIHWTGSFGGGFQGYTIGNIAAAQLYAKAIEEEPQLLSEFKQGNYRGLLNWNNRNLHDHGLKYTPQELLVKSTGERLNTKAYFDYITKKYSEIYKLK